MASIQTKIFVPVALIVFIAALGGTWASYSFLKSTIASITSSSSRTIVENVTKTIDPIVFEKIRERSLEASKSEPIQQEILRDANYVDIRLKLSEIKSFFGLKYLYTATLNSEGNIVYIIDGLPLDEDPKNVSLPGDVDEEVYPDLIKSHNSGEPVSGEFTNNEEWGALISAYAPIKRADGKVIGVVGADIDAESVVEGLRVFKIFSPLLFLAILISILSILHFTLRQVLRPLHTLQEAAHRIETGDLRTEIPITTKDETAALATAFQQMAHELKSFLDKTTASANETENLARTLQQESEKIYSESSKIISISSEISKEAADTARASKEAAGVIGEISQGITEVTAAIEEISSTADATLNYTAEGKTKIDSAIHQIESISSHVKHSVTLINELNNRSGEIATMVSTISDISSRTNLLALNASIEAARAGEQGRGFAVVADEINKLAAQSSSSAGQIAELVKEIKIQTEQNVRSMQKVSEEVSSGLVLITESGQIFDGIGKGSRYLNDGLTTLSGSAEEMSASVEEVSGAVINMNASMQSVRIEFMSVEDAVSIQNGSILKIKEMITALADLAGMIDEQLKRFQT